MTVRERIVDGNSRLGYMRIRSGDYDLIVESRELYTTYKIVNHGRGYWYESVQPILYHGVRSPDPLPIRPARIIHARHIPWFMWIYYGVRDAIRKYKQDRELEKWAAAEKARKEDLRARAAKYMGPGRYGGRYQ
jgi:hypothetical protein